MEAVIQFKHLLFQLERNTKHNGRIFTHYPINASDNGTMLNFLEEIHCKD